MAAQKGQEAKGDDGLQASSGVRASRAARFLSDLKEKHEVIDLRLLIRVKKHKDSVYPFVYPEPQEILSFSMGIINRIFRYFFFKIFQVVWTSYTAGLLLLGRLKYGRQFFATIEHKKPRCLEGWNEGYLQLDSVKLHYVQTGRDDAPLLLMLHGYPEFWYSWRYQLKYFEKDYRCVALDMRGYNLSDKPDGVANYHLDLLANDVRQAVEKLGYSKCYLLSHDWGAIVAWRTALMFPDHLEKLIICNVPHPSAFRSGGLTQLLKSWYIFMFQSPYIPELAVSAGDYLMFRQMFWGKKAGLRNRHNFTDEDLEAWKYTFSQPKALTSAINYYRCLPAAKTLTGEEAMVKPPTLIIFGTADKFVEVKGAENSLQYCRNGRLQKIEDASHWVMQDEPEMVNKYVEDFLNGDGSAESTTTSQEITTDNSVSSKL